MINQISNILRMLNRRKIMPTHQSNLFKKSLSTLELTSLGVAATLGAGIYVVTGQVAAKITGPSIICSFVIAAIASLFSGLCYAEFGSRVPRTTGSAYTYSYVAIGEFCAFVIGWNLILEYMIGTAADATALSLSIDYISDNAMRNLSNNIFGRIPSIFDLVQMNFTSNEIKTTVTPDFLAFILTIACTILLLIGVDQSTYFSLICNCLNGIVVIIIVLKGITLSQPSLWTPIGNFMPYGVSGIISGAATCFYAFVGFDIIATTGEETVDAGKSIPKAIFYSLLIVLFAYLSVSTVITMMIPYYELDKYFPIADAFSKKGYNWVSNLVAIGAICGLSNSLLGSMFPLPRIIAAMSSDGLFFKSFATINVHRSVATYATIYPGLLTAIITLFLDLDDLVEMMSIGTLLAYSLVSLCVLIIRYQPQESNTNIIDNKNEMDIKTSDLIEINNINDVIQTKEHNNYSMLSNDGNDLSKNLYPTPSSYWKVKLWIFICIMNSIASALLINYYYDQIITLEYSKIIILTIMLLLIVASFGFIYTQPQINTECSFKVPFVPFVPLMAICANTVLIMNLSYATWIRFCVWMIIGSIIYFFYGFKNSVASKY